jgi:hypothetical protein
MTNPGTRHIFFLVALMTVGLSLFDGLMTLRWVGRGVAVELNPAMAVLIAQSPAVFLLGKLSLLGLSTGLLYRHRGRRLAATCLWMSLALHTGSASYHVGYGVGVI